MKYLVTNVLQPPVKSCLLSVNSLISTTDTQNCQLNWKRYVDRDSEITYASGGKQDTGR
jgi:hypothetical protein